MSKPPTLIDMLYQSSFRKQPLLSMVHVEAWRSLLKTARRFVIDDPMSSFMGELATRAFVRPNMSVQARNKTIEHLRMSARLPASVTWIEYNLRICQQHSLALMNRKPALEDVPTREGWLLQRHPHIETAFIAHIALHDDKVDGDGYDTWAFPVALAWTVDMDTVLPWRRVPFDEHINTASEVATGITGYRSDRMSFVFSPLVHTPKFDGAMTNLLAEWAGVQRRMWALLATINDLPVIMKDVRQAKGFVARGAYRKFLDHKTVTLTVPMTLYRKTARNALALAHRRGGPVREHWRRDWRRPLSAFCDHQFDADEKHMFCKICDGRRIWVIEHVRGSTAVGFVTHDFVVTHDP
jgi:hypothetical protein